MPPCGFFRELFPGVGRLKTGKSVRRITAFGNKVTFKPPGDTHMGKLRALSLVSFLTFQPLAATAQTVLQLGTPIERQLGPGQTHEFKVNLEENSFIQLVVDQRGIDVVVKVLSPNKKSLGEYDSPTGADGSEHVSFVAVVTGSYTIQVLPLNSDAAAGGYEIKILEMRQANEEELKASKDRDVVKARGIALLTELEGIIPQIKSPPSRIKAQLISGQLLWNVDEKRASKFLSDAISGFKEFIASADLSNQYSQEYSAISELRYSIVQVLTERDPDAALNFLHSTRQIDPSVDQRERFMQDTAFELAIADQISRKDPARALQIARRILKTRFSQNLTGTISQLWRQNPELAAELANEVAAKLLNEKLLNNPDAANVAAGLVRLSRTAGKKFEGIPANENATKTKLLSDDQVKELLQKMLREALSYKSPAIVYSHTPERESAWTLLNALQALGPTVETIMSGGEAAVQKKVAELNNANAPPTGGPQQYERAIIDGPLDASLETIAKAPQEFKEQLYIQLANREANNGDLARARQIVNDHVSNPHQRRQALANIEQQEIYRAMNAGKIEEALRTIGGIRNSRERAALLSQLIHQIGPGLKRATAVSLLEQARNLISPSPQAQDQEQMLVLLEIARAFARYDSKRGFEILEPLIEQFNELSAAARVLEGFGGEYYEDEELNLNNGNNVAVIAGQMSRVIGALALASFDRAKAVTDRIRLPEVRLKVYLEIADQTINGK